MIRLSTERLFLQPFTIDLIDAAMVKDYLKIQSLGYHTSSEWPEDDLIDALPFFKNLILENGVNGFNSWLILSKEELEIIGSVGFIGSPNSDGNVEIGFGIIPCKRKNGYCYESVMCLINWAFKNSLVHNIIAKCENNNVESISVLTKTGFSIIDNEQSLIIWKLHK